MRCAGLLDIPYGVREEGLIQDLIGPINNTSDNTFKGHPEEWTLAM